MSATFYFYDLETSGFSPRRDRIMQFGGQRTDLNLKPIGPPLKALIKLSPDVLPSPDAVLLTGLTPQQTLSDGLTEAEFLKQFYELAVTPNTIFVGFNSIRFDDEFMRFLNYRNFYDAYGWQWQDGNSRWDLLDVVRMTRALRPKGIKWAYAPDGKAANRLEYITSVNKLDHGDAHDALADVKATIAVAKLVKKSQPDLFNYLLTLRDKRKVAKLVDAGQPLIYTSGHFPSEHFHTSPVVKLISPPGPEAALVYDLRHDPRIFVNLSQSELVKAWAYSPEPEELRLPVKTLKYNRAPAVAPMGVIKDKAVQDRLQIDLYQVTKHLDFLRQHQADFAKKMLGVVSQLDKERAAQQVSLVDDPLTVDEKLYEDFVAKADQPLMRTIRQAPPEKLTDLIDEVHDRRLKTLLPLYKARNYPSSLTPDERQNWDNFLKNRLIKGKTVSPLALYFNRLNELLKTKLTPNQKFLVEELKLYGESIMPIDGSESEAG